VATLIKSGIKRRPCNRCRQSRKPNAPWETSSMLRAPAFLGGNRDMRLGISPASDDVDLIGRLASYSASRARNAADESDDECCLAVAATLDDGDYAKRSSRSAGFSNVSHAKPVRPLNAGAPRRSESLSRKFIGAAHVEKFVARRKQLRERPFQNRLLNTRIQPLSALS